MNTKNKIKSIVWIVVPVILVLLFIIKIGSITSTSMEPLLEAGDKVIINRLSYVASEPQKGDVVAFKKDSRMMIKRIVAGPEDMAESKDGTILLNGYVLMEPYVDENVETNFRQAMNVPEGHYLVLGDNREESIDSRFWEEPFITEEQIIGRVVYVLDGIRGSSVPRFEITEKK